MEPINLSNIAEGAVEDLFGRELAKLVQNIDDVSTSATAAREITVKIKFKPSEDRASFEVEGQVTSKLAPATGFVSRGHFELGPNRKPIAVQESKRKSLAELSQQDSQMGISERQAAEDAALESQVRKERRIV